MKTLIFQWALHHSKKYRCGEGVSSWYVPSCLGPCQGHFKQTLYPRCPLDQRGLPLGEANYSLSLNNIFEYNVKIKQ